MTWTTHIFPEGIYKILTRITPINKHTESYETLAHFITPDAFYIHSFVRIRDISQDRIINEVPRLYITYDYIDANYKRGSLTLNRV